MRLCNRNMKNFPFKLQNASHRRPIDHNYPYYDDPKKNFGKRFQVMYVLYCMMVMKLLTVVRLFAILFVTIMIF